MPVPTGSTTLLVAVVKGKDVTDVYKRQVQDPSGTKLGQLVQETEEAVAEAVEREAEAVTETKKGMWSWLLG